jgi:hypothetical protein
VFIFSLALVVVEFLAILQFCSFLVNKSCKTYLQTILTTGNRNLHLTPLYYFITNIYSYLETPGGQSSNLYLNVVKFFSASVN